jgi:NIPSNAP
MKKRLSIHLLYIVLPVSLLFFISWSQVSKPGRAFYQLTVYHYSTVEQEKVLDNYLQNALLPALHRMNIPDVGVFKAIANDTTTAKSLYVFISMKSMDMITKIPEKLSADKDYQAAGSEYITAVYTLPPYNRMETILLKAFSLAPQLQLPALKAAKKDRVYELRSYESATEKIFRNKVQMFNEGDEIGLFAKLNFNAIFYSEVIAGSKMPNLMYMTSFENMTDRDAHWKSFGSDTTWKRLSSMPMYQKNVSHIDITFLRPVDYSDF